MKIIMQEMHNTLNEETFKKLFKYRSLISTGIAFNIQFQDILCNKRLYEIDSEENDVNGRT